MTKKLNFKIQNYFNKSITKHEPLYTKQPISSLYLNQIECFFIALEVLNARL
jgi:cytochrome c oxidase assembly protein Cox11